MLRLAGAHGERALTTDALNYYEIVVEANPNGWEDTLVQKYQPIVKQEEVKDKDGNVLAGQRRETISWEAQDKPYNVKLYPSAGWSALDRLLG